jgi:hypothetical protein
MRGSRDSNRCACRTTQPRSPRRERQMIDSARHRPASVRKHLLASKRSEGSLCTKRWHRLTPRSHATRVTICSSTAADGTSSTRTSRSSAGSRCRRPRALSGDLTRAQVDAYCRCACPIARRRCSIPYTIVRRKGAELIGVKYHDEFAAFITPAAAAAPQSRDLSDDPAFAKFLRLRADALVHRRLLRERHRMARPAEPEVRLSSMLRTRRISTTCSA